METEPIKMKRIDILLEKYQEILGNFDLIPVEKVGYILQSQRQKPMAENSYWVFFDLDDTLVATTEAKKN